MARGKAKEIIIPEVDYVFDDREVWRWMHELGARKHNVYRSIRFEPFKSKEKDIDFVLHYLVDAIIDKYKYRGKTYKGVLYVHENFANRPALDKLKVKGNEGDYIAYEKE